jgi:hypothetical protein
MNQNSIKFFKTNFYGGTRANRFVVSGSWPTGVSVPDNEKDLKIKIFASSMPKSEVGTIAIPYRGRAYYLPGDRQYSVWSVDVYDDTGNNNIWKAFNKWKELLDSHENHTVSNNDFAYENLQKTWNIKQLSLDDSILRTITLYRCWPSEISSLTFDMGSTEPATFRVTLTFDYFKITNINV